MILRGWPYEGRKISDLLNNQILEIINTLKTDTAIRGATWPVAQKYLSKKMGIATGQLRTIKRMMEKFGIVYKDSLNGARPIKLEDIVTKDGETLMELLASINVLEKMKDRESERQKQELKTVCNLFYFKALLKDSQRNENGEVLTPLKVTLRAIKEFDYIDYWEWYMLNTFVTSDNDRDGYDSFKENLKKYRVGKLRFTEKDILENQLSHSYILGNFEYVGIIEKTGRKTELVVKIPRSKQALVDQYLKER